MKELCTSSLEFKNKWQNTLLLLLEMIVVVAFMISQTSLWLKETFTVIYQCKKWILFSNKKFTLRALWKSNRRKVFRDVIKLYLWVIQRPFQGCSSNKASFSAPIPWVLLQGSLSFGSYVVLYVYYYYLAQIRAYIHIKRCYPLI